MQLKRLAALAACLVLVSRPASAQEPPRPNPRPSPDEAIKTILDLSDSQLQQIKDLRASFNQNQQDIRTQMRELQQKRRDILQSSPPDAGALAALIIQEENLRKQTQDENKAFRDTALTLLTASQKEKVTAIQEALKLVRDAAPLMRFGLLEGPGGGPGFAFGGPGPGGPGPGGPGFGGPGDVRVFVGGGQFEIPVPPPGFVPPPPGQ